MPASSTAATMTADPIDRRPMRDFLACGWLHELNRLVAHPHGVHIAFWLDDDPRPDGTIGDGTVVLGWQVVPLEVAELVQPSPVDAAARLAAFRSHIAQIRGGAHAQDP